MLPLTDTISILHCIYSGSCTFCMHGRVAVSCSHYSKMKDARDLIGYDMSSRP